MLDKLRSRLVQFGPSMLSVPVRLAPFALKRQVLEQVLKIMKEIGDVLTEEILFGHLTKGGKVKIGRKNDKTTFSYL